MKKKILIAMLFFVIFIPNTFAKTTKLVLPGAYTVEIKKNQDKYVVLDNGFGCTYEGKYTNHFINISFDGEKGAYITFNENPDDEYEGMGLELDGSNASFKLENFDSDERDSVLINEITSKDGKSFNFMQGDVTNSVYLQSAAFVKNGDRICPTNLYIITSDDGHGNNNKFTFKLTNDSLSDGAFFLLSTTLTASEKEYKKCLESGDCTNKESTEDGDVKQDSNVETKACYYKYKHDNKTMCDTFTFTKIGNVYSKLQIGAQSPYEFKNKLIFTDNEIIFGNNKVSDYINSDGSCIGKLYFYVDGSVSNRQLFLESYRDVVKQAYNGDYYEMTSVSSSDCVAKDESTETDKYEAKCGILTKSAQDFIYRILDWIKYGALVLTVGLSILDFFKAVSSEEDDAFKKAFNRLTKRIIVVVILFILPALLEFVLKLTHIQGVTDDPLCTK